MSVETIFGIGVFISITLIWIMFEISYSKRILSIFNKAYDKQNSSSNNSVLFLDHINYGLQGDFFFQRKIKYTIYNNNIVLILSKRFSSEQSYCLIPATKIQFGIYPSFRGRSDKFLKILLDNNVELYFLYNQDDWIEINQICSHN